MSGHSLGKGFLVPACIISCALLVAGCAGSNFVLLRDIPSNPLAGPLQLLSSQGPRPTDRTSQLLRRFDLEEQYDDDPPRATGQLQKLTEESPSAEKVYALAELAYIRGQKAEEAGHELTALDRYGESVTNAYTFLMDSRFDWERNPYDPQFRRACDLYNGALERALRILKRNGDLRPGHT